MDRPTSPFKGLKDVQYVIVPNRNSRKSLKRQADMKALLIEGYRVLRVAAGRRAVHWLLVKFDYSPAPVDTSDEESYDDEAA
jgi:hypothetical protein